MRIEERDKAYLWDMLDAALAIQGFVQGKTPHDYLTDRMLRGASDTLKQACPEIPWRSVIAQRNILAHEYGEVRHEMIWNVATIRIPEMIAVIRAIVPGEEKDE